MKVTTISKVVCTRPAILFVYHFDLAVNENVNKKPDQLDRETNEQLV